MNMNDHPNQDSGDDSGEYVCPYPTNFVLSTASVKIIFTAIKQFRRYKTDATLANCLFRFVEYFNNLLVLIRQEFPRGNYEPSSNFCRANLALLASASCLIRFISSAISTTPSQESRDNMLYADPNLMRVMSYNIYHDQILTPFEDKEYEAKGTKLLAIKERIEKTIARTIDQLSYRSDLNMKVDRYTALCTFGFVIGVSIVNDIVIYNPEDPNNYPPSTDAPEDFDDDDDGGDFDPGHGYRSPVYT